MKQKIHKKKKIVFIISMNTVALNSDTDTTESIIYLQVEPSSVFL